MSVEKLVIRWRKIGTKCWCNIVSKNITSLQLFFQKVTSPKQKKNYSICRQWS